jgi:putative hydrolase of the HAD superfamily
VTGPKALLLDWYGTLAFNPRPQEAVERAMAAGLARALAADTALRALDAGEAWRRYRAHAAERARDARAGGRQPDLPGALREALAEMGARVSEGQARSVFGEAYVGDPELGVRLFEDAAAALETWRMGGLRLALVSNREYGKSYFADDLARLGVRPYFDCIVISADVGYVKPHPLPFRRALSELGVSADEALMAGDEPLADIEGARAAGLAAVWVRRDRVGPAEGVPAAAVVASLAELARLVP